jgi:ribosome recycling factor
LRKKQFCLILAPFQNENQDKNSKAMQEEVTSAIQLANEAMDAAIDHLQHELAKVRTGKASPSMFNDLLVPYYGAPTPLSQVANVSTSDARTILIQPWEKSMLAPIEKSIFEANLGVTPQNDGEIIRINIPPLTEERRKDLVKRAKALGEDAKVSVRNARHKAMDSLKKAVKNGYPEDAGKRKETEVQDLTTKFNAQVDKMVELKEKDIMTI